MVQKSINYRWNESFFDRTTLKSQPQILSENQTSRKSSKITKKEKSKMKNLGINNRYSQNQSYKL